MPIFPIKVHAADKSDIANVTQGHVLKSINTDAHQCEYILCHRTIHFKMVKTVHFMLYIFYHKKISHVKKVKRKWSRSVVSDSLRSRGLDPVGYQAPPSMGFSRQGYWDGLLFSSPGNLPDQGIEPGSPALQADALISEPPGKPLSCKTGKLFCFIFFFSSWPCLIACWILVPRTGIEPTLLAMKAWGPNYWTTREFSYCFKMSIHGLYKWNT